MRKIHFILIVLIVVSIMDLMISRLVGVLIKSSPDAGVNQTNTVQALFHCTSDALILGASRANHSYVSQLLEDSLGLTTFNAGVDGQNIIYNAMVFKAFLKRTIPKLVILDVLPSTLDSTWMSHLKDTYCFYGINQDVRIIVDDISTWVERTKLYSGLYRNNNVYPWLIHSRLSMNKAELKGYRPLPVKNGQSSFVSNITYHKFNAFPEALKYLNMIVSECEKRHIRLIITYTPSLSIDKGNFLPFVQKFCNKKKIAFWSWNGDTAFTLHPQLFYDPGHLNDNGAKEFTKQFVQKYKATYN